MIHSVAVGRLGKDAEFDGKLTKFSLAVPRKKDDPPMWISCSGRSIPQALVPHLKKGRVVTVRGSLEPVQVKEKFYLNLFVEGVSLMPENNNQQPQPQYQKPQQTQYQQPQQQGDYLPDNQEYLIPF